MAEANDWRALDAENTWKKAVQDRVQQCANTKGPQGGGAKGDKEAQVKAQKELVEELVKEQYMSFRKEHMDAYKKYRDGKGDRDIEQEAGGQPRGEESADLEVLDDPLSAQPLTLGSGSRLATSRNCATNSYNTWMPSADEE